MKINYKGFVVTDVSNDPPLGWLPKKCYQAAKRPWKLYAKTLRGLKCRITWHNK